MEKRPEAEERLALVRRLYKRACRANYYAKSEVAKKNGLQGYFYILKYHWIFIAVCESLPNWQDIFEVVVDYTKWLVCVRLRSKGEDKGLHLPVAAVEKYLEFLRRMDELEMYLDIKLVFRDALYAAEAQRWDASSRSYWRQRYERTLASIHSRQSRSNSWPRMR